jgi:hypothetical protein
MYSFNTCLWRYAFFILNRMRKWIVKIMTSKTNLYPNGALVSGPTIFDEMP